MSRCFVGTLHKTSQSQERVLFQRPKKRSKIGVDGVCFDNMVVGERTLSEKMKCISMEAEFSKIYTNHSICTLGARDFSSAVSGFCQVFIVTRFAARGFGLRPKLCRPTSPAERKSRRTREKPLVPRVLDTGYCSYNFG